MKMFENFLKKKEVTKSPEDERKNALRLRIKELQKERDRINADERARTGNPFAGSEVRPATRQQQINQEIENLTREINGEEPLNFHGSIR